MNIGDQLQFLRESVFKHCYKKLNSPVIVTSGKSLTPFFLNGENLMEDSSEYKLFEMNPFQMRDYALERYEKSEVFRKAIDYSLEETKDFIYKNNISAISGGRTRDWPFAGVIAKGLGLPFIVLYKPEDEVRPKLITNDIIINEVYDYSNNNVLQIVDLTTTCSSILQNGGWKDQIEELGANFSGLFTFIDRNQGAEGILGKQGIPFMSMCSIDNNWTKKFDPIHADIIDSYLEDPREWTISYLKSNGTKCLTHYFLPEYDKDERHLKFLREFGDDLNENTSTISNPKFPYSLMVDLKFNLKKYKISLDEILKNL